MAKIKISELSSASAVSSTDIIVVNQSSTTKKATVALLLADYATSAALTTGLATKEDSFSKNTAFNKNFGTGTTNVVEIGAILGNSQVVETNASGKLITAAKATGYNLALGTTAGTVLEGSNDALYAKLAGTQTITGSKTFSAKQTFTTATTEMLSVSLLDTTYKTALEVVAASRIKFGTGFDTIDIAAGSGLTRVTLNSTSLSCHADTDSSYIFGRAKIGSPSSDIAYFAHYDHLSTTNFGFAQAAAGAVFFNAPAGQSLNFRIANASYAAMTSSLWTFSVQATLKASTTSAASLNIPSGTAPTTPANGDIWSDGTDLLVRLGGVTYTLSKV